LLRKLKLVAAKEKLVMPEADPPRAENCQRCGSAAFPNSCPPKFSEGKFRRVNGVSPRPAAGGEMRSD